MAQDFLQGAPPHPLSTRALGGPREAELWGRATNRAVWCARSGKYQQPAGWRPHRKGDTGLDSLSPDKQPWNAPERETLCTGACAPGG